MARNIKFGMEIYSKHTYTFYMKYLYKSAVTNMAVIQDIKVTSDILNIQKQNRMVTVIKLINK